MCRRIRNSLKLEQERMPNHQGGAHLVVVWIYKKKVLLGGRDDQQQQHSNNNNNEKKFSSSSPLFFSAEAKLNPGLLRLVILLCLDEHTRLLLLPPSLFFTHESTLFRVVCCASCFFSRMGNRLPIAIIKTQETWRCKKVKKRKTTLFFVSFGQKTIALSTFLCVLCTFPDWCWLRD